MSDKASRVCEWIDHQQLCQLTACYKVMWEGYKPHAVAYVCQQHLAEMKAAAKVATDHSGFQFKIEEL